VAGLGIVFEAFTDPGDGIIIFTPVYHAFARKIEAKGRRVVESQLNLSDGRYEMNLDALADQLNGSEKMVIFCSPHNPGGRLWDVNEIKALVRFCKNHDLLLISDEIHMDLVFPGFKHLPTAVAAPEATPLLITLSAASKGFNIAGAETSFIAVEDGTLRAKIAAAQASFGGSPNRFGMLMMEAAFSHGQDWSDEVCAYLSENFRIFKEGVDAIPGLSVMDMESTYLVWVDFSGTGMARKEFSGRVAKDARLAVNQGPSFGTGGEDYLRFNIAMRRALVVEAVERLAAAFGDLQ
jgi:cystathionine beta-lyase